MKIEDFLELITETIEAEKPVNIDDKIDEIEEWDSLGVLSLVAMLDDMGISFDTEKFENIVTVKDFISMLDIVDG
jgi:acyl carrier protein